MRTLSTFSEEDNSFGVKSSHSGRMQWLAVLTPASIAGMFEFLRHQWLETLLPQWLSEGWFGNLVGAATVAVVVYVFVRSFTEVLQRSALEVTQARAEAAVVVERQRIAREMHDSIAQTLFYLSTKLREVDVLVLTGENEEAHGELRAVREETKATYRQVKEVIADLRRQAELEDLGAAVRVVVTELAKQLRMQITCEVAGRANLPALVRQHVLAIIQEALINAHRHGHARHAAVHVKLIGKEVTVEVCDEGVGFEPGRSEALRGVQPCLSHSSGRMRELL